MTLTERIKVIAAVAIEKYRDDIDEGTMYQFHLTVKVDKRQMPFEVLVDVQRKLEVEGVRLTE